MKRIVYISVVVTCLLLMGSFMAYAGHDVKVPYTGSKEYERMKQLVGVWEGTSSMGKEGQPVKVEYRQTAGGSTIVETLFLGTPEEMTSVYYDDHGRLTMTHYCMLQNQPIMKLVKAEGNELVFTFAGGSNINQNKDAYMHGLTISFTDKDHIVQNWTLFKGGKETEVTKINLARVKQTSER